MGIDKITLLYNVFVEGIPVAKAYITINEPALKEWKACTLLFNISNGFPIDILTLFFVEATDNVSIIEDLCRRCGIDASTIEIIENGSRL